MAAAGDLLSSPDLAPAFVSQQISASFTLTVNPADAALKSMQQQPVAGPAQVTVNSGGADLGLSAFVHKEAQNPSRLWVELFVTNRQAVSLAGVQMNVADAQQHLPDFANVSDDPYAPTANSGAVPVGGIGPEGVGHVSLAFPTVAGSNIVVNLSVSGKTAQYAATSSAPLAVTPDGGELWVAQPDSNLVVVVDTGSDQRSTQVAVPGTPRGVAITPDGELVLVASADGNQVSVIDRKSRAIQQTLGEADGIGRDLRYLVLSPDGQRAYVSAYVSDTVTALTRSGNKFAVAGNVAVGRRPTGLSVSPDGGTLLVSHFLPRGLVTANQGWVSVVDTAKLAVTSEAALEDDENVSDSGCLATELGLPTSQAINLSSESSPTQIAGVSFTPGGAEAWSPGLRMGSTIPMWEGNVAAAGLGPVQGLFAPAFLFVFNSRVPAATQAMLHPGVIDFPDTPAATLQCLKPRMFIDAPIRQMLAAGQQVNPFAAFPSGPEALSETGVARFLTYTRGGRRVLVPSYITDELMVYDALTHEPTSQVYLPLSGANPVGIAVTPDGKKGYVVYDNSLSLSVLDLSAYADPSNLPPPSYVPYQLEKFPGPPTSAVTGTEIVRFIDGVPMQPPITEVAQIALVDRDPLGSTMRRGRELFNAGNPDRYPQITVSREASCATCHPFGGNDGSAWGTMEGERRTLSLWGGVSGRGWLHQSGTHSDALTFVELIVAQRLGGKNLGAADAAALAGYVATGIPRLQNPVVNASLAAQGKLVFQTHCASCHAGDKYTSGNPDPNSPYGGGLATGPILFDVGTAGTNDHVILGSLFASMFPAVSQKAFSLVRGDRDLGTGDPLQMLLGFTQRPDRKAGQLKAPSLIGAWDNVLFFHDGRFTAIEDAVGYLNTQLKLGLSAADQTAVIAYIKTL